MLQAPSSVIYPVRDIAQAKEWYQNVLQAELTDDHEFYVGFTMQNGFEVGLDPHGFEEGMNGPVLCYLVEDVQKEYDEIISKGGVSVSLPQRMDNVSLAYVQDLDGNRIGLLQRFQ